MNKTKRKIFETSMKLFAEKGYDATSIEEITATVVRNNESINEMTKYSTNVINAVKIGEELAHKTTTAMDELCPPQGR